MHMHLTLSLEMMMVRVNLVKTVVKIEPASVFSCLILHYLTAYILCFWHSVHHIDIFIHGSKQWQGVMYGFECEVCTSCPMRSQG